jgi:glutathione S-transferase
MRAVLLAFVALVAYVELATGFGFGAARGATTGARRLSMAGGRSLAEKSQSTRTMFKELRSKLNEAATKPGFFDTADSNLDLELLLKSNKDGTQIGDCPFAQFLQLVMLKKGLKYKLHPVSANNKPAILDQVGGKLPALVYKGKPQTDSLQIAEFIEKTYPHNSLTRQGSYSYQEVLEKTSGFFPALSAFIKNKDESKDASLQAAVDKQLDLLDELLRSTPGQFLCGVELTLADLYLVPQLFHAMVALEHFKDLQFYHVGTEPTRPALETYVARMFDMEEFNDKRVYYNVDQVIFGWKVARGEATA